MAEKETLLRNATAGKLSNHLGRFLRAHFLISVFAGDWPD